MVIDLAGHFDRLLIDVEESQQLTGHIHHLDIVAGRHDARDDEIDAGCLDHFRQARLENGQDVRDRRIAKDLAMEQVLPAGT